MNRTLLASCAIAGGLLVASGSAFAHHGTSQTYDPTKLVTNSGTVTRFVWANPHGRLNWEVKDRSGKVVTWGGELHSIGLMTRAGWSRSFVRPGEQVTVSGRPARAGTPYMVVTEVVLNGKSYFRDLPEQGAGVN
jgi:hypothetical protein